MSIARELWLRGFAASMFFSNPTEIADGTLVEQFKSYDVDTVIWLQPGRIALDALRRLSDMGIQVVVISSVGTPGIPSRYYIWKNRAIEALVKNWKDENSVREITVIDSKQQHYRSPVTEELLRVILEYFHIEPIIRSFQGDDSLGFLRDLSSLKTDGIIFPSADLVSMFAFRNAQELAEVIKTQRIAFVDGPFDMFFSKMPEMPVDLVMINWRGVVDSIVSDLITREAFDRNRHTTFEAELRMRVSLRDFGEQVGPSLGITAMV